MLFSRSVVSDSLWHQACFCFMFWFFGHKACGILALCLGIEPTPHAGEGEVLTPRPPGTSWVSLLFEMFSILMVLVDFGIYADAQVPKYFKSSFPLSSLKIIVNLVISVDKSIAILEVISGLLTILNKKTLYAVVFGDLPEVNRRTFISHWVQTALEEIS